MKDTFFGEDIEWRIILSKKYVVKQIHLQSCKVCLGNVFGLWYKFISIFYQDPFLKIFKLGFIKLFPWGIKKWCLDNNTRKKLKCVQQNLLPVIFHCLDWCFKLFPPMWFPLPERNQELKNSNLELMNSRVLRTQTFDRNRKSLPVRLASVTEVKGFEERVCWQTFCNLLAQ